MNIVYIGVARGTSLQRAQALERLQNNVTVIDPWKWFRMSKPISIWLHHMGGIGFDSLIKRQIIKEVHEAVPDLIWVNDGTFFGPSFIRDLHHFNVPVINYSADNPYADGSKHMWSGFRKAIKEYDLLVTTFEEVKEKLLFAGARKVLRVYLSADEVIHRPVELSDSEHAQYGGQVSYIAQWAPERGYIISELLKRGVPLSVWGVRWEKAGEWPLIKKAWRGTGMFDNRYTKVVGASKINLCLLSKSARNLHTSRSIEIPAIGGLLCAERSIEHEKLYKDGIEAVFWTDIDECSSICFELLKNEARRKEIAQRGNERALRNNLYNEPVLASIIDTIKQDIRR